MESRNKNGLTGKCRACLAAEHAEKMRRLRRRQTEHRQEEEGQPSTTEREPTQQAHRPPSEEYPVWAFEHEPTDAEWRAVMSKERHLLNDGSVGLCRSPLCPCRKHATARDQQGQARHARVAKRVKEIEAAAV